MKTKRPVYAWCFRSSSGPKLYQTIRYSDSSLSCDCPGWTRRVAPDGSRTCKHVRSVQIGTAQIEAVRHNALSGSKDLPENFPLTTTKTTSSTTTPQQYKRKLIV